MTKCLISNFINFRDKVALVASNKSGAISDTEVLEFYNLATSKMLGSLEVNHSALKSPTNIIPLR
jgi:hypothetical protein